METVEFQKANPQPGDVYVSSLLTSVAYTYANKEALQQSAFQQVMPQAKVPVQQQVGKYTKYNKGDILRAITEPRAPGTGYAGLSFDVDNSNYYEAVVYGAKAEISDEVRANYQLQDPLDAQRTRWLTRAAMARREQRFSDVLFATSGSWDKVVTGTSGSPTPHTSFKKWDLSGSSPVDDIKYARTYIGDSTGIDGNTLVLSQNVWDAITTNGNVVDRLVYADRGIVTEEIFARMCGIQRVVVGRFRRNTANKGATNSIANVLGDKALLCYLPANPGPDEMAAFQFFLWTGLTGSADGMRTTKRRDQAIDSDIIQVQDAFDVKLTCADLGYLFSDCTG